MLVYGLIVNSLLWRNSLFLLFISSVTIVFGQNQNQILLLLIRFILMQMSFLGMILLVLLHR
jgi:hypothetical protein